MASNVKVVVRVRPLNKNESGSHCRPVVDVVDEKLLVFDPKEEERPFYFHGVQQPSISYLKRANKELRFVFDHVCGDKATNQDIYEITTKDVHTSLMDGYNCSVFAYGATGAGKTFTMIGNTETPGITYLTMEHLFHTINELKKDREFEIGVSYMEVYNENVYDLIKPSKTPLQLREDHKCGVMVAGLTINNIKTARELLDMLENGNKNRTQHPTDANAESSRSHAVFQVYIKMTSKTSTQTRVVKLSMIDLAGSKRASATGCVGERFKEGANINRSLLSLANCINKLADGGGYIPYRDSKLTRLLKDSLGGNCKTVMIANISPSSHSYKDTYNTLKYAARANKIQLSIKNIVNGDMRLTQYVKTNEELKKKVKELESKLGSAHKDNHIKFVKQIEDLKKKNKELETKVERDEELQTKLEKKLREIKTKLALSSLQQGATEEKEKEWRDRITDAERQYEVLELQLLGLMAQQKVLALRHEVRTEEFSHVAALAHRSSSEAMEMVCLEEIPRQERAAESYTIQALCLDAKIMATRSKWVCLEEIPRQERAAESYTRQALCLDAIIMATRSKWEASQKSVHQLCNRALSECPNIASFVELVNSRSEMRQLKASNDLRCKLSRIGNGKTNTFMEYAHDMENLLKKLYLAMKGYDKVTPSLTAEYLDVMKKAKLSKGISWSDNESESGDYMNCDLSLEKPAPQRYLPYDKGVGGTTIDTVIDSEDLTDIESKDPVVSARKRKGTPIKLNNNETIIINDSLERIDLAKAVNSAKKLKREDVSFDVENCGLIQAKDLNSTSDMQGNMETLKKTFKDDAVKINPVKRELADRTNTMQKPITFNERAKIVKPVVGRALTQRKPAFVGIPSTSSNTPPVRVGFGSTVGRDGNPLARNNVQAPRRPYQRCPPHPYSRPNQQTQRK